MPDFLCPRCNYTTNKRTNIVNHYNRKRPCKTIYNEISLNVLKLNVNSFIKYTVINTILNDSKTIPYIPKSLNLTKNDSKTIPYIPKSLNLKKNENKQDKYICKYCDKIYSNIGNLNKHYKKCKLKVELCVKDIELQKYKEEWSEERKELLNHINKLIDKTGTTINNVNNINNQIQNNFNDTHTQIENETLKQPIKLRDFGDENMEHITHDFCKELLKEPYSGPNKLVRAIHFNPNYIENSNVQATNRKSNITAVVRNGKWEYMNKRTLLNREYIKTNKILDDCFDKEKNNLSVKCRELYEHFKIARNDLHQYNNTLCNIFIEILNGTNEIKLLHSKTPKLLAC